MQTSRDGAWETIATVGRDGDCLAVGTYGGRPYIAAYNADDEDHYYHYQPTSRTELDKLVAALQRLRGRMSDED